MASTVISVLSLLSLVAGYSFDITAAPTQCGPLSLQITGGSGKPPYTALIVPYGPSPSSPEQRKVFQHQFSGNSVSFTLPFPTSSTFVVMLSDSNAIGSGGTSVPIGVGSSNNNSCLPSSVSTDFSFQILPNTAINQCQKNTILAWNSQAQDPVSIYLVIPGGQSSSIPIANTSPQQGTTTGFQWTPNIRAGTNILLVAGDARGPGTGGSVNTGVVDTNSDSSCIDNQSPSSTPGTAAGAVETGSSGSGKGGGGGGGGNDNGGGGGSSTNVGAIVGGVVGGLAALAVAGLVALFFVRRRRRQRHPAAHGVDLLPEGGLRDPDHPPEFYQPEPFLVPPHSHAGADENAGTSTGRPSMSDVGGNRYSAISTTDQSESAHGTTTGTGTNLLALGAGSRSTSYGPSSGNRKTAAGPPQLRPVNFVQHEDAGELPETSGSGPAETIELPPSYTSVRR